MERVYALLLLLLAGLNVQAQVYISKAVKVEIFSKAPIEDIDAKTDKATSVFNAQTKELQFNVPIRSFVFPKHLMQEHFNENYMESDKYPNATFKGTIDQVIDVKKDGEYKVNATGDLEVHGQKQKRTISGTIVVKSGQVSMGAEFIVKCADHKIRIPKLVFKNIAEEIKVSLSGTYVLYKN